MLHAVIMAGGSGTRFWPLSRHNRPKQVLPIASPRTMIADTVLRLDGLVPIERTFVVTGETHVGPILAGLPPGVVPRFVAEPFGRDTAACIGLAALHVRRLDPDGVMLVMPADQVISPVERFQEVMRGGVEAATQEAALVTFGIKPTHPATGYGYIHRGRRLADRAGVPVYQVHRFREKPAREVAEDYLASGDYYWNSGIFCWRVSTILDCLRRFTPDLYAALERIAGAMATPNETTGLAASPGPKAGPSASGLSEAAVLREAYGAIEKISIDYAVMEKAETIRVVEADFAWSDVGSWASVARLRSGEADDSGNVLVGCSKVLDTTDSLVFGQPDHVIGVIGLEGVVVVHTPDATLVCSKERAEDVKLLVERLRKEGLDACL